MSTGISNGNVEERPKNRNLGGESVNSLGVQITQICKNYPEPVMCLLSIILLIVALQFESVQLMLMNAIGAFVACIACSIGLLPVLIIPVLGIAACFKDDDPPRRNIRHR